MKRVLLVDDDALVLRMYRSGLCRLGFEVDTAGDVLQAIKCLREHKPDLVVLDLMMPKLTGVDFLRYLRDQTDLASVPVVVLSNAYMHELGARAAELGVQKALLKTACSPSVLAEIYANIVEGGSRTEDPSRLLAIPEPAALPAAHPAVSAAATGAERSQSASTEPESADTGFRARIRQEFLRNAPNTRLEIRKLHQDFGNAQNDAERRLRLGDLYRKIHFVTAAAGLAHCRLVALMASAFEALIFELMGKPAALTPSILRTLAATVDFLGTLLERAREAAPEAPLTGRVLVVDDDPLSNRLVAAALRNAQLEARTSERPLEALQWLQRGRYDLLLLDIEMPTMDGFELCRRVRALAGYEHTPLVYVTAHSDFEDRARSALTGGNDLIAKPVFPLELAVKAVTHLIRGRLPSVAQAS
jgi:CheY-like chemotaxis protein